MPKFRKNHIASLLISIAVFISLAFIYDKTNLLEGIELWSLDKRYYLRDPNEVGVKIQEGVKREKKNPRANDNVIIVGIDNDTLVAMDATEGEKGRWPFHWDIHSKVANYIASGKPNSITFDIMFLENKAGEDTLAEAVRDAGCVFLDYPFEREEMSQVHEDRIDRMKLFSETALPSSNMVFGTEKYKDVTPPTAKLIKSAKGIGFANIESDIDHVNRRMPLYAKYKGDFYPSIDLAIAAHYFGITLSDIEIVPGKYVRLKNINPEKLIDKSRNYLDIPIDNEGYMDINFAGGHGSFSNYSYYYFNRDGTEPENSSFKDKIVFIAAYASTGIATDIHKSPYGDFYGIEHHANAVNTIINQTFIHKAKIWQDILILFAVSLILGLLIPRMSIITGSIFTTLFAIIYVIIAYVLFDTKSVVFAMSTPVFQIFINFLAVSVYRSFTEQKEKRYIRQTFSKFVSKSVVDELLKNPKMVRLGGEKNILSVLFSDIRGFTSISEKMTAELLVEHLNEYLQAMTDIVIESDGTLDKYVGDEIMAFWGAPIPQEDHALRTCRAAVKMIDVLNELNVNWTALGKPKLDIGIGINTGEMVVGNMGSASRMNYTLMGDNVNLGARLEGTNKVYGTKIIISEFTYEHVKDHVIARELDLIRVKGKALPVKIYELIDMK